MAGVIAFRKSQPIVLLCALLCCLATSGCGESPADVSGAPLVQVLYQGKPLSDVQVRLHESRGGPVLAQSVSQTDGNAYFTEVPSPEPTEYFVTVESLGDGGWILDAKACEEITALKSLENEPKQRIEIPDGAVKALPSGY